MDCYHNEIQTRIFYNVKVPFNYILDSEVTTRIWDDLGDNVWDRVSEQIVIPVYGAIRLRTLQDFEKRLS